MKKKIDKWKHFKKFIIDYLNPEHFESSQVSTVVQLSRMWAMLFLFFMCVALLFCFVRFMGYMFINMCSPDVDDSMSTQYDVCGIKIILVGCGIVLFYLILVVPYREWKKRIIKIECDVETGNMSLVDQKNK